MRSVTSTRVLQTGLMVLAAILVKAPGTSAEEMVNGTRQNVARLPVQVVACKEPGGTCTIHPLLLFESKSGTYSVGYIEESRRLSSGARRPPDILDGHRIPLPHPQEDFHDADHYSLYRLCYEQVRKDGTNECREVIQPQPEIGQVHPEISDPKRMPYTLLIASMDKEIGANNAQYLTVKLSLQENREPTEKEKEKCEEQNREGRLTGRPLNCDTEVPRTNFNLKYQFLENGDPISFAPTQGTKDTITIIRTKTTFEKK